MKQGKSGVATTLTDLRLSRPMRLALRSPREFEGHVFVLQALVNRGLLTWGLDHTDLGLTILRRLASGPPDLPGQRKLF